MTDIPQTDVENVPIFPEDQPVSTSEESHVEDVDVPDGITNPDDEAQEDGSHGDK